MTDTPLAPSDAERAPDLNNPGNIPFGELPRATQEAMVIAHVLDDADVEALFSGIWFNWSPRWLDDQIYRVVKP